MDRTEGSFRLLGPLGVGGMGEVWRAEAEDGTLVALKVARPEVRLSPMLLRLMDGEVRALARLDHPRVAWLYDHGRTTAGGPFPPGCPYIVLEYCGGGTLADHPVRDWRMAREVLVGLLEALAHAHAHGIVHRDLKPANVLWSGPTDLRPGMKLADFGVAHAMDGGERTTRVGTPWYMAPEQAWSTTEVGPWTDLYALGAVGWELVTGSPPFTGPDLASVLTAVQGGPNPLRPRFPVARDLEDWLRALLQPDPQRRVRHAAQALASLANLDPEVPPRDVGWRGSAPVGPRLRLQGAGLALVGVRDAEFAGRVEERSRLWSLLETSIGERRLRIVVLRGISGIGKSRLCRWLVQRATEVGLADGVVVGCREPEVLGALLAGLYRVVPSPSDRVEAVLAAVAARDPSALARVEPRLRSPTRPWGTVPHIRRLLVAEAGRGPRIVVLDDAQHSPDAVQLVRALAAEAPEVPALVLLAVEEESLAADPDLRDQVDQLVARDDVTTVSLGPLAAAEQEELLRTLVGLDPEAHSAVLSRAGGHPGYLVAQVTSWAAQGVLAPTLRGFRRLPGSAEPAPSWATVWGRWMAAWLETLDLEDRVLLERAAVLGRSVDEGLWEAACDDPEAEVEAGRIQLDLRAARRRAALVDRLIRSGLAYDTDVGFTFTHPSLVEVVVAEASVAGRRIEHHRACANHLRRLPQPDHALALGHHLAESEQWEVAAAALLTGIGHAWQNQDRRPLLAQLERAERCVDRAGWPDDDPRRSELFHVRSLLLLTAGRNDEAVEEADTAFALAERTGDRRQMARTLWRKIDCLAVLRRWPEAEPATRRFLALDTPVRNNWPGLARSRLGRAALGRGDREAAEGWFAEAERELARYPDDVECVASQLELYDFWGRHAEVAALGERAEVLAREEGRVDLVIYSVSKRVEAAMSLTNLDLARELAVRSLQLNEPIGDRRFDVFMRIQLATLELRAGRIQESRRILDAVLADIDRTQLAWLAMMALVTRIDCSLQTEDWAWLDRDLAEVDALIPRGRFEPHQILEALSDFRHRLAAAGDGARAAELGSLVERVRRRLPSTSA